MPLNFCIDLCVKIAPKRNFALIPLIQMPAGSRNEGHQRRWSYWSLIQVLHYLQDKSRVFLILLQSQWWNFGVRKRRRHNFFVACCIWQAVIADSMPAVWSGLCKNNIHPPSFKTAAMNSTPLQVKRISFSPDGSILASAHSANVVALWSRCECNYNVISISRVFKSCCAAVRPGS